MPRKALFVGALVALVGLVAAAIAVASSSQAELTKPETIHVVQHGGQITFLPINPKKDVFTGDLVVVNGPVFDASGKTKVGWQHAECTVMEPKGVVAECAIETFLQHGMIAVKGPLRRRRPKPRRHHRRNRPLPERSRTSHLPKLLRPHGRTHLPARAVRPHDSGSGLGVRQPAPNRSGRHRAQAVVDTSCSFTVGSCVTRRGSP